MDDREYIQYTEPNRKALADLLIECKGSDRTMAQFAEACGSSPSTFSRIANGNIAKPQPEETLKLIYEHRAEGCKVELDDLYRANGMFPREERNRIMHGSDIRRQRVESQEQAQQILLKELLRRGFALKADMASGVVGRSVLADKRTDKERGDLTFRYDLGVELLELHDLSEWLFSIEPSPVQAPSYMENRPPEMNARMQIRRMLQVGRADIFLIDAWQPERLEGMKYSWVFTDKYLYDAFRDYLRTAKLNNAMSTILLDLNEKTVLKEEWMNCPMKDDYVSLFRDPMDREPGTDYESRPQMVVRRERMRNENDGTEDTE